MGCRRFHIGITRYPKHLYQGGTVAAIYGQMQMSRIDFIYYKGGLKVLSSKIVRTAPEIDYVWASDHAAVLTVFEVE